jgi:hypothetical protein
MGAKYQSDKMCEIYLNREIAMSILMQSKPKTSKLLIKWNLWRIVNSSVIFFPFFIPWVWGREGGIYTFTGFHLLDFIQYMARFEIFVQEREFSGRVRLALGLGQLAIDLYSILIYCVLNLLLITFGHKLGKKFIGVISVLCLILIMLGARSLWKIPFSFVGDGWHGLSFTLWGYWLVLIGLVSSFIFEISYFISKRN